MFCGVSKKSVMMLVELGLLGKAALFVKSEIALPLMPLKTSRNTPLGCAGEVTAKARNAMKASRNSRLPFAAESWERGFPNPQRAGKEMVFSRSQPGRADGAAAA